MALSLIHISTDAQAENNAKQTSAIEKSQEPAPPQVTHVEEKPKVVEVAKEAPPPVKTEEPAAQKQVVKEKTGWEAFAEGLKKGQTRKCSQAEIALGQCR